MPDIIQLLPDHVANQIAAGEVVQRPASVVKELLENSIDASSTSIQLIIRDAGKTLIQVIDNGNGMSTLDAKLSFERHATSKIRVAEDLFKLHTKGFRGEALASIAAYISVTGLSKIFPVAASIFLFGALEISKLVTASLLHNHWKRLNKALKTYLTIAVVFLIVITSAGLYSFLSSAYSKTATKIEVAQKENALDDLNKKNLEDKVVNYQDLINSKNKRIDILADQRSQQETRLDSLYARRAYNSAKRTETLIKDANSDISQLTSEVDSLNTLITTAQSGVYDLEIGKIDREVEQSESDVLTFIYISELTGLPIGKVINWLVILLVFIFDPLAVLLLVSFNSLLQHRREFVENEESATWKLVVVSFNCAIVARALIKPVNVMNRSPNTLETPRIVEVTVDAFEKESVESAIAPVEKFERLTKPDEIVLSSLL